LPGTPDDVGVALRSARLSPSGTGLILTPRRLLPIGVRYQLTVAGDFSTGLTDRAGTLLDGDRDGLAGGDSVNPFTIRRRGGVQPFAQAVPNASTARRLQAARFGRFASPARFV
jgi:hypothetical protein